MVFHEGLGGQIGRGRASTKVRKFSLEALDFRFSGSDSALRSVECAFAGEGGISFFLEGFEAGFEVSSLGFDLFNLRFTDAETLGNRELFLDRRLEFCFLGPSFGELLLVGPLLSEAILFGPFLRLLHHANHAADDRTGETADGGALQ